MEKLPAAPRSFTQQGIRFSYLTLKIWGIPEQSEVFQTLVTRRELSLSWQKCWNFVTLSLAWWVP